MASFNTCPEFPWFGARYPDATCIDGMLWDLDKCTDNGGLYGGGEIPCPFCNSTEFIKYHHDPDPLFGHSVQQLQKFINELKSKYKTPTPQQ